MYDDKQVTQTIQSPRYEYQQELEKVVFIPFSANDVYIWGGGLSISRRDVDANS